MNKLLEDSRSQLLTRSKSGANYAPSNQYKGKNRYERRVHSKVSKSVKEFNSIDMNKLFKDDILDVNIQVQGETDNYIVTFKMSGVMANLQKELDPKQPINFRQVTRALVRAFNSEDVYVRCSCPDWKYRFGYFALKHSISSYDDVFNTQGRIVDAGKGEQEPTLVQTQAPRFDWTNKFDNKGPACKHVLMVLSNNSWLMKVASVISNYIKYMEKHMPDLYAKIIYPALFKKKYEPMSQYDMEDEIAAQQAEEEPLDTEKDTVDISNKWAATKDKFKPGNQLGIKFAKNPKNQIDFDNLISDTD